MKNIEIGDIWESEYNKHETPDEMLDDKYVYVIDKEKQFYVCIKLSSHNKKDKNLETAKYQVPLLFPSSYGFNKTTYINCNEMRFITKRRFKHFIGKMDSFTAGLVKEKYENAIKNRKIERAVLEQLLFDLGYDFISEMSGGGGPVIGMEINDKTVQSYSPGMFIIDFGPKSKFNDDGDFEYGYAVANDYYAKRIYRTKNGKIVKEDAESFLEGRDVTLYEYIGDNSRWLSLLKIIDENTIEDIDDTFFFEYLTGKPMRINDQFNYDENFKIVNLKEIYLLSTTGVATLNEEAKELTGDPMLYFPVMSEKDLELQKKMQSHLGEHYKLMEDPDGYYLLNEANNNRTKSVNREFIENMF